MVAGRHPECMMSVTRHGASRSQFFSAREVVRLYVVDGASDDEACDRKGRKFAYELVTSSKTLRDQIFETWNAGSRKAETWETKGRGAGKMNASLCAGARGQQGAAATVEICTIPAIQTRHFFSEISTCDHNLTGERRVAYLPNWRWWA